MIYLLKYLWGILVSMFLRPISFYPPIGLRFGHADPTSQNHASPHNAGKSAQQNQPIEDKRMTKPPSPTLSPRRVADSQITLSQVIFPRDTNELGLATAGVILKNIDIAASLTAAKHSGKKIVTASLDRMDFINPAKLWELVSTRCIMTQTWKSSMEVAIDVDAENVRTGEKRHVAVGYLVFVALDDNTLKPGPVPPLQIETSAEETTASEAETRRQERMAELALLGERKKTEIESSDHPERVVQVMTEDDSNIHQNVFGGVILELIHQAAQKAASAHAQGPVIAVRQDRMSFEQPAYIGEEVTAMAVVTRAWKTSMEIQVDVVAKNLQTQAQRKVASSYMVFVAQDPEGKPKPVSAVQPKTPKQKHRYLEADVRRSIRLLQRKSISH